MFTAEMIREARQAWEKARGSMTEDQIRRFRIFGGLGLWLFMDKLTGIYRKQRLLRQHGRVVWAHVVQVNERLFSPGRGNYPACVVHGTDSSTDSRLDVLADIALTLGSFKGTAPMDPHGAQFARILTNEMNRTFGLRVPKALAQDLPVVYTTIMVHRKHLPSPYLASNWFPLLVAPDHTDKAMILPAEYWGTSLVEAWN